MNIYNPQMYDESKTARKQKGNQSGRVFYIILIGLAISGCLILALSLLVPHKTGTVMSVGRITSSTQSSGMRNRRRRYPRTISSLRSYSLFASFRLLDCFDDFAIRHL